MKKLVCAGEMDDRPICCRAQRPSLGCGKWARGSGASEPRMGAAAAAASAILPRVGAPASPAIIVTVTIIQNARGPWGGRPENVLVLGKKKGPRRATPRCRRSLTGQRPKP